MTHVNRTPITLLRGDREDLCNLAITLNRHARQSLPRLPTILYTIAVRILGNNYPHALGTTVRMRKFAIMLFTTSWVAEVTDANSVENVHGNLVVSSWWLHLVHYNIAMNNCIMITIFIGCMYHNSVSQYSITMAYQWDIEPMPCNVILMSVTQQVLPEQPNNGLEWLTQDILLAWKLKCFQTVLAKIT